MGGGVHPLEWVIPVVGATHLAVDEATKAASGGEMAATIPGSPDDLKQNAEEDAEKVLLEEQRAAQQRVDERRKFFEDFDEEKARGRARETAGRIAETMGGGGRRRRASDYLTNSTTALGGGTI